MAAPKKLREQFLEGHNKRTFTFPHIKRAFDVFVQTSATPFAQKFFGATFFSKKVAKTAPPHPDPFRRRSVSPCRHVGVYEYEAYRGQP